MFSNGGLASAASADAVDQTVNPRIFLIDPLAQRIFIGLRSVGTLGRLRRWRSVCGRDRRNHDDRADKRTQGNVPFD
jgi:hypothetical protein